MSQNIKGEEVITMFRPKFEVTIKVQPTMTRVGMIRDTEVTFNLSPLVKNLGLTSKRVLAVLNEDTLKRLTVRYLIDCEKHLVSANGSKDNWGYSMYVADEGFDIVFNQKKDYEPLTGTDLITLTVYDIDVR